MTSPQSATPKSPRILVIGADPTLREFCSDGLPWAGCATEFATDIAEAMTGGFSPDVMVTELPNGPNSAAMLMHLKEYAEAIGSAVIVLTDDRTLVERLSATPAVQMLIRPCLPEALWDALAIAMAEREAAQ